MSSEFDYRWAKDLVLLEMERDGVLHRAKRATMSAVCGNATNYAYGIGLVRTDTAGNGFAAAAAVFDRLASAPQNLSAAVAEAGEWREAARRALAKARWAKVANQASVASTQVA